MEAQFTKGHAPDADEAKAEFAAMGLHVMEAEAPATANDWHWHDFDSITHIVEGSIDVTAQETGKTETLNPGDRIHAPRGFVHRERHDGLKVVFGFKDDPATFEMPIERALPVTAPA